MTHPTCAAEAPNSALMRGITPLVIVSVSTVVKTARVTTVRKRRVDARCPSLRDLPSAGVASLARLSPPFCLISFIPSGLYSRSVLLFEEFRHLRGALPAQDLVAVREAPEAFDGLFVLDGVLLARPGPFAETLEKLDGVALVFEVFAVHERHVKEPHLESGSSLSKLLSMALFATASAFSSASYIPGVPRNMLRENWSSTIASARAPRGRSCQ